MWPSDFFPPSYFTPDYWPRPSIVVAGGKGKGIGGKRSLAHALIAAEHQRRLREERRQKEMFEEQEEFISLVTQRGLEYEAMKQYQDDRATERNLTLLLLEI